MKAMSREEMEALVEQLDRQLTEVYCKEDYGPGVDKSILYPPAAEKEIAAYEKKAGVKLPPSYRQFLSLHNGWKNFWFSSTLAGTSGKHSDAVAKEFDEAVQWQAQKLEAELGGLSPAKVKAWEKSKKRFLFLRDNALCFGTDFAGALWVFDRRTARAGGEMAAVWWSMGFGVDDDESHKSFEHLLRSVAERVAEHHAKLYKSRVGKAKAKKGP